MVDAMGASHNGLSVCCAKAKRLRLVPAAFIVVSALSAALPSLGQELQIPPMPPKRDPAAPRTAPFSMCQYPHHNRPPAAAQRGAPAFAINEVEPNNTIAQAQVLPLGLAPALEPDMAVAGSIGNATDIDVFRVTPGRGNVIGFAVLASGTFDSVVGVFRSNGSLVFLNDAFLYGSLYPPNASWPLAVGADDAAMTFTVPDDGDYLIAVFPYSSGDTGTYTLQLVARQPFIKSQFLSPTKQKIFLDFDGATIDSTALFGSPAGLTFLSPLSSFLAGWGLTPADESAVIDAIIAVVNSDFDALRQVGALNGDFPVDQIIGNYDFQILNSRDHPDPFGQPNVSRVVIGGTIDQLGFGTVGIAEHVDPGNFAPENTAVVLLDRLSGDASDPVSINGITRAPSVSIINAIGLAVGQITSHEIGHYLGSWHTVNDNSVLNIMDSGTDISTWVGVGNNGVLDLGGDDLLRAFITDEFSLFEYIGVGEESSDVITAFSLSTGGLPPDLTPPQLISEVPARDSVIATLESIDLTFDETVTQIVPEALRVNGSPATAVFGSGVGPYTFMGFAAPGNGIATVELGTASISDEWGNDVPLQTWNYEVSDCNANLIVDADDISQGISKDCNANLIPDECDADIVHADLGPDQKIRFGDVVLVGAEMVIVGGLPPFSYEWTLRGHDSEQISNLENPEFSPIAPGTYVVRLILTDAQGCQGISFLTITVDGSTSAGLPPGAVCGNTCGATGVVALAFALAGWMALGWREQRRHRASNR